MSKHGKKYAAAAAKVEAGKLKVTLMIFGRETPVELDFNQVAVIA